MAEPIENNATNTTENNVLDGIESKVGDEGKITTDGIYSYEPTASSEEIAKMNAPGSPDLKPQDYFPDLNERTLRGTYSGPTIGTVSLFAPGGGLTPYTVIDAREKALEAAALKKAKQIEDFNKLYGAPPVTKHSSVQKELNKVYFDGLNNWVTNSQKKYGDNWAQALKNDLSFQSWIRDANTLKEQEDYLVNEKAKIEKDIEGGRFVATPELRKSLDDFDAGVSGMAQGKLAPQGYNLANSIATMSAEYDLSKSINESIVPVKYGLAETFGVNKSDPNYDQIVSTKMQEVPDQTLKDLAVQLKREKYFDSKNITEDMIFNRMRSMFPKKQESTIQTASKRKPEGTEEVVTEEMLSEEPSVENVDFMKKGGVTDEEQIVGYNGYTFKSPVKTVINTGTRILYPQAKEGGMISKSTTKGAQNAIISEVKNYEVINAPGTSDDGRIVTAQMKKRKPGLKTRHETYASGYFIEEEIDEATGQKGKKQVPFYIPAKDVSTAISKKDRSGKVISGAPLDIQAKKAKELDKGKKPYAAEVDVSTNKTIIVKGGQQQTQQQSRAPKEGDTKTLGSGKTAIFTNGKWQLK
jgi:hypothetical protein